MLDNLLKKKKLFSLIENEKGSKIKRIKNTKKNIRRKITFSISKNKTNQKQTKQKTYVHFH